jgi:hypothetical protein
MDIPVLIVGAGRSGLTLANAYCAQPIAINALKAYLERWIACR